MKNWLSNLRNVVLIVALANLSYFGVEFLFAILAKSVSLFADSIDFLEDAAVNILVFFALRWSPSKRAKIGKLLAAIICIPGLAAIAMAVQKFMSGDIPEATVITWVGIGALLVNSVCALLLARVKQQGGSLSKAAFLSSRNDVFANMAIIIAGFITIYYSSFWPDLIVGAGIAFMNFDAAKEVWEEATKETI